MSRVVIAVDSRVSAFEAEAWAVASVDGREVARRPLLSLPRGPGLDEFFDAELALLESLADASSAAASGADLARTVLPLADLVAFAVEMAGPADLRDDHRADVRPGSAPALPAPEDPEGA